MFDEKIMRTNPASPVPITKGENDFCITEGNGITLLRAEGQNGLDLVNSDIRIRYKVGNTEENRPISFNTENPVGIVQDFTIVVFNMPLIALPIVVTIEKLNNNESLMIFFT